MHGRRFGMTVQELKVSHRREAAGHAFLEFRFSAQRPGDAGVGGPLWVPLEPLEPAAGAVELWLSDTPVAEGPMGDFHVRQSGDLVALSCLRTVPADRVAAESERVYLDALQGLARVGFPHLLRVWNYVPAINAGYGEDEHYKQFCSGRAAALRELQIDAASLPAASAMGCAAHQPLHMTFLAGRVAGRHLENPRQLSAHRYPSSYGQQAPCFARATLLGRRLLISGTAAIIGHESQFPGDVDRQLRCTLDNLLLLMDHACAEGDARRVEDLRARVYLRHPEHLARVREAVETDLPALASAVYLQADVCRRELLVEVEATGVLR
jgi:chorismate lyase / 3-hydroxybenzoate synthase